jgi:hypothetical protein
MFNAFSSFASVVLAAIPMLAIGLAAISEVARVA